MAVVSNRRCIMDLSLQLIRLSVCLPEHSDPSQDGNESNTPESDKMNINSPLFITRPPGRAARVDSRFVPPPAQNRRGPDTPGSFFIIQCFTEW